LKKVLKFRRQCVIKCSGTYKILASCEMLTQNADSDYEVGEITELQTECQKQLIFLADGGRADYNAMQKAFDVLRRRTWMAHN
jgi:hypothetical protein